MDKFLESDRQSMKPLEYFEFENNYRFSLLGLGLELAKHEYSS